MKHSRNFIFYFISFFIISIKANNIHKINIPQRKNKKFQCGSGKSNYTIKKVSFNNNHKTNYTKRLLNNDNNELSTPINIYYDMTYLNNQKLESSQELITKINMIDKAMSRCVNIFKKLINIKKQLNSPIKIKTEQELKDWKFNKYSIHPDLMPKSKGISCDLVILIRFKNENENNKYELPEASAVYIDE